MAAKKPRRKRATAPKAGSKRKRFTSAERAAILADAGANGLTGAQVAKKYGISTVTYYLWRSKNKKAARASRGSGRSRTGQVSIKSSMRAAVRERIRASIPDIVRAEVSAYLDTVLGSRH